MASADVAGMQEASAGRGSGEVHEFRGLDDQKRVLVSIVLFGNEDEEGASLRQELTLLFQHSVSGIDLPPQLLTKSQHFSCIRNRGGVVAIVALL